MSILKRSFYNKIGQLKNDNQYHVGLGIKTKIHPESFLFLLK